MQTIIVLFNLRTDADRAAYERWALTTDLPTVRAMRSVRRFDTYRVDAMLGSDAAPPYEYVEVIDLSDLGDFREEVKSEVMQRVAGEFHTFADQPVFMVSERFSP